MPTGIYKRTNFCSQGHDKDVVGRDLQGHCKECESNFQKYYYLVNKENIDRKCKEYGIGHRNKILANNREYYKSNREFLIEYQKIYRRENPEKIKLRGQRYRKSHPEVHRVSNLKCKTNRNLRIPKFGQDGIVEFYRNCPAGMVVDHIIPLCGKKVSGLHVRWNLQYLISEANNFKRNSWDGTLENSGWMVKFNV